MNSKEMNTALILAPVLPLVLAGLALAAYLFL